MWEVAPPPPQPMSTPSLLRSKTSSPRASAIGRTLRSRCGPSVKPARVGTNLCKRFARGA